MVKKAKTYTFVLKNINTEIIDKKYSITLSSNIISSHEMIPQNSTKIDDLIMNNHTPEVISFLDESKHLRKCNVSMVDFEKDTDHEEMSFYNCFWCRFSIPDNIKVLGCPLKYVPHQVVKSYYSEISKDKYTIKENITYNRLEELEETKDKRFKLIKRGYYMTDGAFCSFNCCMAYINDNKTNPLYRDSHILLLKIYNSIHHVHINDIDIAPHWRKLINYTGDLTIEQFRHNFNKVEYIDHGITMNFPTCYSIKTLFEENLKF
jgi:hypothetical protein